MPVINNATVATGTGLSTAGNGGRRVVRLSNGWLISAASRTSAPYQVNFYKSSDNGATWSLLTYTTGTSIYTNCSIVAVGTKVYAVAQDGASGFYFWSFNATTVGSTVSVSNQIETGQTAVGNISLAINDAGTELHAAWSSRNATYPGTFVRYSKGVINQDGSVTWQAVEQVLSFTTSGVNSFNPSIRVLNNIPIIVAPLEGGYLSGASAGISADQMGMYVFKKDSTLTSNARLGSGWTYTSIVTTNNNLTQSNPSAIFVPQFINGLANGRLWVAWHGKDATDSAKFNVRVSYSDDGGVTWATPVKLTSGNTFDCQNVSLGADKNGKVFALYESHQWAPDIGIRMKTYNGSWGTEVGVATANTAEQYPSSLVDYSLMMTTPPTVYTDTTEGIKFVGNFNLGAAVSPASGALGNKETATLTAYTVTPEAGSTVTSIVEKVNGVTVNTFNNPASLSRTLTVPTATWDTLAYFAIHTASIAVTDSNGATTVTTYSFDKRLATGASLLEATKANTDAKNRMRSQLDAIGSRVGVANGSSTNQIISAIDSRNVVKRQNGTAVVSGGQIVVNTLGFLPKTITIRSSATQNGTYSELLGTNESRNGTTITQNAFTSITATGFTALISGTNVTWEAQG